MCGTDAANSAPPEAVTWCTARNALTERQAALAGSTTVPTAVIDAHTLTRGSQGALQHDAASMAKMMQGMVCSLTSELASCEEGGVPVVIGVAFEGNGSRMQPKGALKFLPVVLPGDGGGGGGAAAAAAEGEGAAGGAAAGAAAGGAAGMDLDPPAAAAEGEGAAGGAAAGAAAGGAADPDDPAAQTARAETLADDKMFYFYELSMDMCTSGEIYKHIKSSLQAKAGVRQTVYIVPQWTDWQQFDHCFKRFKTTFETKAIELGIGDSVELMSVASDQDHCLTGRDSLDYSLQTNALSPFGIARVEARLVTMSLLPKTREFCILAAFCLMNEDHSAVIKSILGVKGKGPGHLWSQTVRKCSVWELAEKLEKLGVTDILTLLEVPEVKGLPNLAMRVLLLDLFCAGGYIPEPVKTLDSWEMRVTRTLPDTPAMQQLFCEAALEHWIKSIVAMRKFSPDQAEGLDCGALGYDPGSGASQPYIVKAAQRDFSSHWKQLSVMEIWNQAGVNETLASAATLTAFGQQQPMPLETALSASGVVVRKVSDFMMRTFSINADKCDAALTKQNALAENKDKQRPLITPRICKVFKARPGELRVGKGNSSQELWLLPPTWTEGSVERAAWVDKFNKRQEQLVAAALAAKMTQIQAAVRAAPDKCLALHALPDGFGVSIQKLPGYIAAAKDLSKVGDMQELPLGGTNMWLVAVPVLWTRTPSVKLLLSADQAAATAVTDAKKLQADRQQQEAAKQQAAAARKAQLEELSRNKPNKGDKNCVGAKIAAAARAKKQKTA